MTTTKRRPILTWTLRVLLALVLLLLLGAAFAWWRLRASLPELDGRLAMPGLTAPVDIRRDALGVPVIAGANRNDVAFATGFAHAQDRFFQMDMMRRRAAGELSELIGAVTVEDDVQARLHRFRARAGAAVQALPPADRELLQRYADGVNAGLASLSQAPFEYALLRGGPAPWQPADTMLVVWAMYLDLQWQVPVRELARGWLRDHASPEALAFLLPEATEYDTPMDDPAAAGTRVAAPATAPDWIARPVPDKSAAAEAPQLYGSNGWAIAGGRTRSSSAMVANDMHLGLMLPNTWYRAQLRFPGEGGAARTVTGATLPGTPVVIIGSNGDVAWGFTNAMADVLDLVRVERDASNPLAFKVGGQARVATEHREAVKVGGGEPRTLTVLQIGESPLRQVGDAWYIERWTADLPGAADVGLRGLEVARTVDEALAVAARAGIPALNFIAGDRAGRIGWVLAGTLPARDGTAAATFPLASDAGAAGWQQLRPAEAHPRIVDPPQGRLWNANNRQLAGEGYRIVGDGGVDLGARARQIGQGLAALDAQADEKRVYGIQLDDRALFMAGWRDRALRALDVAAVAGHPERQQFRDLLATRWTGRASVDSQAYLLTRLFMRAAYEEVFGAADAEMRKLDPRASFAFATLRWPAVLARLLDERPAGWLPPARGWHDLERAAVDRAIGWARQARGSLENATWGSRNTAAIAHPLAAVLPGAGRLLAAPPDQLPGDEHMPRVSAPNFGASERMVVSPGREQDGIFNMPGGQSGHPLSPYFLAGHGDWVKGAATPFLPGEAKHTLSLAPK